MGQGMSRKEFLAEYKKIEEDKERNAAQREMRQRELVQQAIATLSRNQLQAEINNLREELRQAELRASRQQQQANLNMMRGLYMMSMLMMGMINTGYTDLTQLFSFQAMLPKEFNLSSTCISVYKYFQINMSCTIWRV